MIRDPEIPQDFDVYTVVLLRRGPKADEFSEAELDELQAAHLAYRARLHGEGVLVVNGPFGDQSDATLRGMSIFACGLDEAERLNNDDPSVAAGRLSYDVMEWWVGAGALAFPKSDREVGTKRSMLDE
jgi:uncharacterized protein